MLKIKKAHSTKELLSFLSHIFGVSWRWSVLYFDLQTGALHLYWLNYFLLLLGVVCFDRKLVKIHNSWGYSLSIEQKHDCLTPIHYWSGLNAIYIIIIRPWSSAVVINHDVLRNRLNTTGTMPTCYFFLFALFCPFFLSKWVKK